MIPLEHLEKRRPHFGAQLCGAGCRHHNRPTAGSPLPALPWSTKASEGGVRNVGGTGGAPQGPGLTPRRPYPGRTGAIRTAGRPVHPGSALGRGPGPCAPALTDGSDGGPVRPATVAGPHPRPTAPASGGAPRTRRPEFAPPGACATRSPERPVHAAPARPRPAACRAFAHPAQLPRRGTTETEGTSAQGLPPRRRCNRYSCAV